MHSSLRSCPLAGLALLLSLAQGHSAAGQPSGVAAQQQGGAREPLPPPETLVDQDRLMGNVRMLPTKRAVRADKEHRDGLLETQRILIDKLRSYGYQPELQRVDFIGSGHDEQHPFYNIIVEIPGKGAGVAAPETTPGERDGGAGNGGPAKGGKELLIVSAHLDAVPRAPGADDDGSGVAAVLELARLLKDRPMQRTVRLIFFNLEEAGMVGSTAYVEEIRGRVASGEEKIIGMASLDMLGYYCREKGCQRTPLPEMEGLEQPEVGDFIAIATISRYQGFSRPLDKAMRKAAPGLKTFVFDIFPIPIPDLMRSDHAPFMGIGVPAVIMTDTANFRSAHYHQPTDTIDTLDPELFTLTVRGLVGAVHELARPIEGSPGAATSPPPR